MKKTNILKIYGRGELASNVWQAVLVRVSEPVEYGVGRTRYLYVSAARVGRDDEVYLFPADKKGEVLSWLELYGSRRGTLSIRRTMAKAGYDVSSWPEEIE